MWQDDDVAGIADVAARRWEAAWKVVGRKPT